MTEESTKKKPTGRPRKQGDPNKTIWLRLDSKHLKRLEAYLETTGETVSSFTRRAVMAAMAREIPKDDA